MENYLMIDGLKIPLTDDQLNMIRAANSPFSRVCRNSKYYYVTAAGICSDSLEILSDTDDKLYKTGNYCTDLELMSQRAMHEILNRLLWRFAMENGEGENPWNKSNEHYFVYFDTTIGKFEVSHSILTKYEGTIYFSSEKFAKMAIKEIVKPFMKENPDFVW